MATKTKNASPPPVEYASAMDKLRDEMAKSKDAQIALLGEGLTTMLLLHPEWEGQLAQRDKDIKGALAAVRKNAFGGCSDPVRTTKSLIEYYGINCADPRRLALEVTAGMMGGEAPDTGDGEAVAAMASQHVGEIAAAMERHSERLRRGEITDRHPDSDDTPADPFDLDALMGVM